MIGFILEEPLTINLNVHDIAWLKKWCPTLTGTGEQFQHGGGRLILNVIKSHQGSSTYHLSSGLARVESLGGGVTGLCQGGVGGNIRGKQHNGSGARCRV